MIYKTTKRFWSFYFKLPNKIQALADKAFLNLKDNHNHPGLQFKKVGKLYSARIDASYRALAYKEENFYIWIWIGNHTEYDQLIN